MIILTKKERTMEEQTSVYKKEMQIQAMYDYMEKNRLTKRAFCKQCGIGTDTFNRMIDGSECKLLTLLRVARAMGTSFHDFCEKAE